MHTEETVIHKSRQGECVKHLHAHTPDVDRSVLTKTLVVKPIYLADLTRLMVASK